MYARLLEPNVRASLSDTRVVLVTGPRQSGKTTFLRQLSTRSRAYVTLDNVPTLEAAKTDPVGFIRDLDVAAIDEVQRAPELLLAIKESVDNDPRPGRFLLAAASGKHWSAGFVLYDGDRALPFGDRMWAAPVSCLWA